jgi:outer membrane protein
MKTLKLTLTIFIAVAITNSAFYLIVFKPKKVAYIDTGKLYESYKLTKEYNSKLESVFNSRKSILDSLYKKIEQRTEEIKAMKQRKVEDISSLAKLEQEYDYKRAEFEKENQTVSIDYTGKVWNQINKYMTEYGQENGYELVLGANGQGNIMFGDKKLDITESLIKYLNSKYDGIN